MAASLDSTIDITAVSKLKHAKLWAAAKKVGGQAKLAKALGLPPTRLGEWVNFKSVPSRKMKRWHEIDALLSSLCEGDGLDELFHEPLREATRFLQAKKTQEETVSVHFDALLTYAERTSERLAYQFPSVESIDLSCDVEESLRCLTERQREILKLRFGLCGYEAHTLLEVAVKFGVTKQRIRQIEQKALRHLSAEQSMTRHNDNVPSGCCRKCGRRFDNIHACKLHEKECGHTEVPA